MNERCGASDNCSRSRGRLAAPLNASRRICIRLVSFGVHKTGN
jgi:hypothetical protein